MNALQQDKNFSYVEASFHILKELKNISIQKRHFIISTAGPKLILAFSEIFYNLIKNSKQNNLFDPKAVKILNKNFLDIGILINFYTSLKLKREIILKNKDLQKLSLNLGLEGYQFYKNNIRNYSLHKKEEKKEEKEHI